MRPDLLEGQACIDWTVSKLPDFALRMDDWLRDNMYVSVEDAPPPATHDVVVILKKEPFPLVFNVEFGAYLNTLRSSLDLLANSLAVRHIPRNVVGEDKVYFPVASSAAAFASGNYKGKEFVNALPQTERALIESLEPYKGGKTWLWLLHHFDIKRKHRALLGVRLRPIGLSMAQDFPPRTFVPDFLAWGATNQKTVLGTLEKGVDWARHDLKATAFISVHESLLIKAIPVIEMLNNFAGLAQSIIKLFDF